MSVGSIRKLSANSFLYSISSILQRASSIFLFPIFSSFLTKSDYGILSYTNAITTLLLILSMTELPRAMSRIMYDKGGKTGHVYSVVGSVFVATMGTSIVISSIVLALAKFKILPNMGEISFYPFIFFTIINIPFQALFNVYITYIKSAQKGRKAFVIDNTYFLLNIGFNLLFVVGFKMNIIGMIYSTIVSNLIMGTYAFFIFYRRAIFYFDKKILITCYKYAFSVFPFILFGNLSELSDNYFLNEYVGAGVLGIFYIATTFGGIFSIVKESVLSAFQPYYFSLDKHDLIDKKVNNLLFDIMLAVGIGAMLIAYFNYEVVYIFSNNKDLIKACDYIPLLVIGYYLVFVGQLFNIPTYLSKKNVHYMSLITIIAVIINIGGNYLLIPKFGILGLVFVKLANYGSQIISSSIINKRNEKKYHFSYWKMYLLTVIVASVIMLYYIPNLFIKLFNHSTNIFQLIDSMNLPHYVFILFFKSIIAIIVIFAFYFYSNRKYKLNNLIVEQLQKFNIVK